MPVLPSSTTAKNQAVIFGRRLGGGHKDRFTRITILFKPAPIFPVLHVHFQQLVQKITGFVAAVAAP